MTAIMTALTTSAPAAAEATDPNPTSSLQRFGLAIVLFFPLLAVLVVGLRVYSRVRTKQFGLDDTIVIVATVLSIGETAASYMYMKTNYVGIHIDQVPAHYDLHAALVWNFVVQVLYNPILALVKTSVLLFLLKLGSQKRIVRRSIYVLNTLNLALMVAIFIVVIFQCKPIAYNWDPSIKNGHCIKKGVFYMATATLTILTDIFSLALPLWVFLDLKLAIRVKVALLFVFLLGGLVTAVSIVRLVFFYRAFFLPVNSDPTYSLGFCLSSIETNLAIVCASAPSLRGLVRYWFPHFFSSQRATFDYNYRYPNSYSNGSGRGLGNHHHGGHRHRGGRANDIYGASSVSTRITSWWKESGKGSSSAERRSKRRPDVEGRDAFALGIISNSEPRTLTDVQSHSLSASEEEIMTYNGIVRTVNVSVQYDTEERGQSHESGHASRPGSSIGEQRSLGGGV